MKIILATPELAGPGGAQSYAITVGEHLARLGHEVTLYARELGHGAERAGELGLAVAGAAGDLPDDADATLTGVSRALALELAARYPAARRAFVVHGDDQQLPPPVPGAVAATVALNDRTAALAAASVGAGEVVRLRQPVDLRVFSPRGEPRERPARVLLLGNYHARPGERATALAAAWGADDLEWRRAGWPDVDLDPATAIADADIVVGIGRCVLEAMACGRPAYVHDHAGSAGWLTPATYPQLEASGFALAATRPTPDAKQLRADLDAYDPALGRAGQDLARRHHDARAHVAALVALFDRLAPEPVADDPAATRALLVLAEAQLRAETYAERYRIEAKQWAERFQTLHRQAEEDRIALVAELEGRIAALKATRRYRIGTALARPLERLRRQG